MIHAPQIPATRTELEALLHAHRADATTRERVLDGSHAYQIDDCHAYVLADGDDGDDDTAPPGPKSKEDRVLDILEARAGIKPKGEQQ